MISPSHKIQIFPKRQPGQLMHHHPARQVIPSLLQSHTGTSRKCQMHIGIRVMNVFQLLLPTTVFENLIEHKNLRSLPHIHLPHKLHQRTPVEKNMVHRGIERLSWLPLLVAQVLQKQSRLAYTSRSDDSRQPLVHRESMKQKHMHPNRKRLNKSPGGLS